MANALKEEPVWNTVWLEQSEAGAVGDEVRDLTGDQAVSVLGGLWLLPPVTWQVIGGYEHGD